jgi:hypothetical protein
MLTMRRFAGAADVAGKTGGRIARAARQALSLGAKAPELFNRFLTVSQSGLCRLTRIAGLGKNCLLKRA